MSKSPMSQYAMQDLWDAQCRKLCWSVRVNLHPCWRNLMCLKELRVTLQFVWLVGCGTRIFMTCRSVLDGPLKRVIFCM